LNCNSHVYYLLLLANRMIVIDIRTDITYKLQNYQTWGEYEVTGLVQ